MKPAHLKCPFTWKDRKVLIHDRVWYVPDYCEDYRSFSFPGWDHSDLFVHKRPIKIEYCSGNGAWIAARAIEYPLVNWVGVELNFERARRIWSKIKNHRLDNLLVVCGEGHTVTQHYIPDDSVEEVFVNFPDPWPKNKHAKHRIIQLPFVQEIHRILQSGGTFTLVTDDVDYSKSMINVLHKCPEFESVYPSPYFINEWPNYGTSYFEQLWREQGKMIHYHQFRKR